MIIRPPYALYQHILFISYYNTVYYIMAGYNTLYYDIIIYYTIMHGSAIGYTMIWYSSGHWRESTRVNDCSALRIRGTLPKDLPFAIYISLYIHIYIYIYIYLYTCICMCYIWCRCCTYTNMCIYIYMYVSLSLSISLSLSVYIYIYIYIYIHVLHTYMLLLFEPRDNSTVVPRGACGHSLKTLTICVSLNNKQFIQDSRL